MSTDATTPTRPLRKDAQRSRRLVLAAAERLFAERGIEVGFDQIAREAGVGVGTVYRRFPDRRALVAALFAEKVTGLREIADEALAMDDAWASLEHFVRQSAEHMQRDRGLADVVAQGGQEDQALVGLRHDLDEAVKRLVARAQEAGELRADVANTDLAVMSLAISRVGAGGGPELVDRYLTLVLDALRARPGSTPLPGAPPGPDDFPRIAEAF